MNGRNRRRKDVPFNPFAQNAVAERNRRHAEKAKEKRRQENQINSAEASTTESSKNKSLEDLQREARKKMGSEIKVSEEDNKLQSINTPVVEKPIEEKSNHLINKFYKLLNGKIKIIGVGGVDSGQAAYDKFIAGADFIQLYTGMVFKGPNIAGIIKKDLKELLIRDGVKNYTEIIGNKTLS